MLPRLRSYIRLIAALLASVGMLALPLRTLAACPMLESGVAGVSEHHGAPTALADEHAGHDMSAAHGDHVAATTASDAPSPSGAPTHETCPDLAHCAVAAIPSPLAVAAAATVPAAALRITPLTAPLSVARALEPPPPKV